MKKITSRIKVLTGRVRNSTAALLLPFMLASTVHALPNGIVGTVYNGALPNDMQVGCLQGQTCPLTGIQEVWYGAGNSWMYKMMSGSLLCSNATFQDPAPTQFKACYIRDLTVSETLPPRVTAIPLVFELNDLLTAENKRYTFAVWDGETRKPFTTNRVAINPKPGSGSLRMQQDFYQFDITDGGSPIRQISVFISPTYERCLNSRMASNGNVASTYGRIMEIYSMTSIPTTQYVAQRSDIDKICTNEKGQLTFNLKPPSISSFQMKILSYDASGRPNDVFDLFIPTNFDWMTMP